MYSGESLQPIDHPEDHPLCLVGWTSIDVYWGMPKPWFPLGSHNLFIMKGSKSTVAVFRQGPTGTYMYIYIHKYVYAFCIQNGPMKTRKL